MSHPNFPSTVLSAFAATFGLVCGAHTAAGNVDYREAVSGDLSNNRAIPTLLGAFGLGANRTTGQIGQALIGPPNTLDLDYATFTIPRGLALRELVVVTADVGGAVSFIGLQVGAAITVPPNAVDASPLLGWAHYGSASQGIDILREMSVGAGAQGFSVPLGPGTYSLWIMELDRSRLHDYSFEFRLVPGPTVACSPADIAGGGLTGQLADGIVDGVDFIAFINGFGEGSLRADIAGAGPDGLSPDWIVDGNDFVAFINSFAAGC